MSNKICVHCGNKIDFSILKREQLPNYENIKLCTSCIGKCRRSKMFFDSFEDRFIIDENISIQPRIIVILLNKPIIIKQKKYREIVGLDVESGRIVKVVDENGKRFLCHTNNDNIARLKIQDVIKAPFKLVADTHEINVWRICGEFEKIGVTNIYKLKEKYRKTYWFDICSEFNDVIKSAQKPNKPFSYYCLVRFTGTPIKKINDDYYMKMGNIRVKLDKNISNISDNENIIYKGIALIRVSISEDKNIFIAKRLYSKFQEKNQPNTNTPDKTHNDMSKNNETSEYENDVTQKDVAKSEEMYIKAKNEVANRITTEEILKIHEELTKTTENTITYTQEELLKICEELKNTTHSQPIKSYPDGLVYLLTQKQYKELWTI